MEKQRFHSPDCANAENHRCRCWCNGKYHGINKKPEIELEEIA